MQRALQARRLAAACRPTAYRSTVSLHCSASGFEARPQGTLPPGPGASKAEQYKLVIYSKPGCHLCDGLKEKVDAVLAKAQFMPSTLTGVQLEIRDITTKHEWEEAYSLTIPVLTRLSLHDHSEVKIARSPPRVSAERLAAHLEAALQSDPQP